MKMVTVTYNKKRINQFSVLIPVHAKAWLCTKINFEIHHWKSNLWIYWADPKIYHLLIKYKLFNFPLCPSYLGNKRYIFLTLIIFLKHFLSWKKDMALFFIIKRLSRLCINLSLVCLFLFRQKSHQTGNKKGIKKYRKCGQNT